MTRLVGFFIIGFILALGLFYYIEIRRNGMIVTSWWRTPMKNREVGGVSNSLHLLGLAWDVVPVSGHNKILLERMGLRVINETDHLHAQLL